MQNYTIAFLFEVSEANEKRKVIILSVTCLHLLLCCQVKRK